jgi:hypothetical protein
VSPRPRWELKPRAPGPEPPRPTWREPVARRVVFDPIEWEWIQWEAARRYRAAEAARAANQFGDAREPKSGRLRDLDGVLGEAAVAKHLNLWWSPSPWIRGAADFEGFLEARWTESCVNARLPIREKDDDSRIFILACLREVVGDHGDSRPGAFLRGWFFGFEAKRQEWASDPKDSRPPAWLVPWRFLRDLDTLPDVHRYRLIVDPDA